MRIMARLGICTQPFIAPHSVKVTIKTPKTRLLMVT